MGITRQITVLSSGRLLASPLAGHANSKSIITMTMNLSQTAQLIRLRLKSEAFVAILLEWALSEFCIKQCKSLKLAFDKEIKRQPRAKDY